MAEETFTVAIVGGGVSGICVASQLADKIPGASMVIFENESDIGGTWHAAGNYPGAACDVPSHFYSYSFAKNANWSRKFSPSGEIKHYLKDVAARYNIAQYARTSTRVTSAVWDEVANQWVVTAKHNVTGATSVVRAQFLVSAVGALYVPQFPDIPGIESFKGQKLHSARWDYSADLAGKRVAVIGTGASAAQLVPQVAKVASQVSVFQRTPPWIVPRRDFAYPAALRWLFTVFPPLLWLYRVFLFVMLDINYHLLIEPVRWLRPVVVWLARRHLSRQVTNPETARKLSPTYEMGCKRVLLSDDYYPTFNLPHVSLETAGISAITAEGVQTADGKVHPADVIIFATGFDVVGSVGSLAVKGVGGADFTTKMKKEGAETYYGITAHGFPNLFICLGPNTGLGHNSIIFMIECQTAYLLQCIRHLRSTGQASLMVKLEAQTAFDTRTQAKLKNTVWATCSSWYNQQRSLEGGRNISMWPGTVTRYWWETLWPKWEDFTFAKGSLPGGGAGSPVGAGAGAGAMETSPAATSRLKAA